ncbi:acyltransferase family protein [Granulosicoccus antarcticus]|uniref:Acyltransferase 3 domain-containing protein n=1 Tax=Granulosicoccus antarcticus IMCC3135 TaxID=1192854 RepID=A0A2Z2NR91_9GAMM|nr:acyltransferase family protein [Granulosicoccus antarcticus]ASJ72248.1 hypothetical protein IMCC3135_10780 [Granulosicoccus antarcticus IMCC3135]
MNTRDSRLDSAKGMLIALVVLGHLLEATNYWNEGLIRYLLTAIYAFHMPAFIFLAGMTSKPDNVKRRIAVLVSLLVIFQCLYFLYLPFMESNKQFAWLDPFWLLWFLLAMVFWLIAMTLAPASPRLALLISVAVGLGSGALPVLEYLPTLDRALYFLPWFIGGYVIGQAAFDKATTISRPVTMVLSLTSLILAAALWYANVGAGWLYGSNGFAVLDVSFSQGVLVRALLITIAAVMTLTLLTSADLLRTVFVKAGKRSLAIYLLHGFFVLPTTPWLGLAFERYGPVAVSLICIMATWLLVYLLSLSVFDRSLRTLGSRGGKLLLNTLDSLRRTIEPVAASPRD